MTQTVEEIIDVTPVWSGHPVGFSLLTRQDKQFIGFYDADRNLTVASRVLNSTGWTFIHLPEKLGWDSHNSVAMALDDNGCLHLLANMHASPLVYFRTSEPYDVTTFEHLDRMIGDRETRCTYPSFMRGVSGEFIFTYRDGYSGNGEQIYNVYNHSTREWQRLIDQPLLSGKGQMNAYLHGPVKGPDGYYHLCWVWRDRSGCELNHDLSYARSRDMVHWETSGGKPHELPMTIDTAEIVDPVPVRCGMINGNSRLGFDSKNRPVISYHKFDEQGLTQAYNARLEDGTWTIYRVSDWDYRWDFGGGGSIVFEIRVGNVRARGEGKLTQVFEHVKFGSREWTLDEDTFEVLSERDLPPVSEGYLGPVESDFPEMMVQRRHDAGRSNDVSVRYVLRWETLPPNRDRPREGELPTPGMLKVLKLRY